jgi:hypothetical protein
MLIEKIAAMLNIKSKIGQLILGSFLTGAVIFIGVFVASSIFIAESKSTLLGAAALCAAIGAVLYFIKGLIKQ